MDLRALLKTDIGALLRQKLGRAPAVPPPWPGPGYLRPAQRTHHLLTVTSQLAALIKCNAPLVHGLEVAAVDAPDSKLESILLALRDDLAAGLALWESTANLHRFFPRYYTDLIKAGEQTGTLGEVLDGLSELIILRQSFWDDNRSFIVFYVPSLLFLQCAIALFVATAVVPQFEGELAFFGAEMPPIAQRLISAGEAAQAFWLALPSPPWVFALLLLLTPVAVAAFVAHRARRRGWINRQMGRVLARLPLIRSIHMKCNLAHVALVLERLTAGGVPLDEALASAAALDINAEHAEKMARVRTRIEQGDSLSQALRAEPGIPAAFSGMVSVGECAGLLPEALGRLGRLYRRQTLKLTKMAIDALLPLCIVTAGAFTLAVCLSVFSVAIAMADGLIHAM
ncbi:MAG: type II secretion system F family protein [Candidatus Hydrogenedentes bacterium]|nr:type II secretion system F family protein [Candidatus Hydrogenedentota bacterium]